VINGLGLGVCLKAILEKTEIESVTVIEKSKDVINLVEPSFLDDPRVTIIHADALEWKAPRNVKYDFVWHDIWDDICTNNLETMGTLHRKYARRSGWQDSWCRDLLKYYQRREKEMYYYSK
jgi:spermidine synthase